MTETWIKVFNWIKSDSDNESKFLELSRLLVSVVCYFSTFYAVSSHGTIHFAHSKKNNQYGTDVLVFFEGLKCLEKCSHIFKQCMREVCNVYYDGPEPSSRGEFLTKRPYYLLCVNHDCTR